MEDRKKLMCANPRCWFLVHSLPEFGGFCCKKCHYRFEQNTKGKKKHGEKCQQVEGSENLPRAEPIPPDVPLIFGGSGIVVRKVTAPDASELAVPGKLAGGKSPQVTKRRSPSPPARGPGTSKYHIVDVKREARSNGDDDRSSSRRRRQRGRSRSAKSPRRPTISSLLKILELPPQRKEGRRRSRCRSRSRSRSRSRDRRGPRLASGDRICVKGLVKYATANGREATITAIRADGRCDIAFDCGATFLYVKQRNLELCR